MIKPPMNTNRRELKNKTPELRFPEFDGEWVEKRLGELADIKRGAGSQYINYTCPEKGIRMIRISDFIGEDPVQVEETPDMKRFRLEKGDILIAGTGATAGITFKVPDGFVGLAFSYNAPRIRTISDCSDFIFCYLRSSVVVKQQNRLFTGNAQPFLDTKAIGSFKLGIPCFPEQKKIAAFLSAVDGRMAGLEKKRALLRDYKKGLMQKLFNQSLRFNDDCGNPFPDWVEKMLGEVSTWKSGGTPSKDNETYWNGEIPWISASSMHDVEADDSVFMLSPVGVKNGSKLTAKGTLLLLVRGSMLYKRIPVCVAMREVAFNQDVKSIDGGRELNGFLLYWFQAKENLLLSMVTGTGIGAGKLDTSELQAMKLQLPSLAEQKKIADCLSAVDRRIGQVEAQVAQTRAFKQGLLQRMFV